MILTHKILLEQILKKYRLDPDKIRPDTLLFSSGLIDSFSMVEMVRFIEKECGFKIKTFEMTLENLDSTERILKFVEKRNKEAAESA